MRRQIAIAITALALLWAGFAWQDIQPADYEGYVRTVTQVAASAHDAVSTGSLLEQQKDQTFGSYDRAAYSGLVEALAGAVRTFAGEPPPDAASRALRDQLAPLLDRATVALGDRDPAALAELSRQLGDFVTAHR